MHTIQISLGSDLAGGKIILYGHIKKKIQLQSIDNKYWENAATTTPCHSGYVAWLNFNEEDFSLKLQICSKYGCQNMEWEVG